LPANAQNDAQVSDTDCQSILEAAAIAPKAVAPDVVKACQEVVAAAPVINTTAAASDCSAPGAANSVHCWGGWNALAPAGAGLAPGGDSLIEPDERDLKPLLAVNDPFPPLPIEGCEPGASCGFSITADGFDSPTTDTGRLEKFAMEWEDDPTGFTTTRFTADPGGANEVQSSLDLSPVVTPLTDSDGLLFTPGSANDRPNGNAETAIFAFTNCNPCDGPGSTVYYSRNTWQNLDENGDADNGVFGWGIATSQADMDTLNRNSATVSFSGKMSLNLDTNATITMMFGNAPIWSGAFVNNVNTDHSFTAGGRVQNVNFAADPSQFSSNVVNPNDAIVQGALLGRATDQAVVVAYDVVLQGPGRVADAGLLVQQP
jgi:hypothetical protein